jgi:hypothetical protein
VTQFYVFPVQREDPCVRRAISRALFCWSGWRRRLSEPNAGSALSAHVAFTLLEAGPRARALIAISPLGRFLRKLPRCRRGVASPGFRNIKASSALLNLAQGGSVFAVSATFHLLKQNSVRHMGPRSLYGVRNRDHLTLPPVINIAQTLLWHES